MSLLPSLVRTYDRMATRHEIAPVGYAPQRIGFLISLDTEGAVVGAPISLLLTEGRKQVAPARSVPQAVKRTSGVASNFLWDKTSYVLGVTAGEGRRTAQEHAAFRSLHAEALAGTNDEGLRALLRFLDHWTPDQFVARGWPAEMMDANVAFALDAERLDDVCLHDRPAARDLWTRLSTAADGASAACLVTGESGPVARLHPTIKGVWGAQTSGASLVAFNAPAFESYGHAQGDNAPVSQAAAEAYGAVLNTFLERDSRNRLQVGDASTVFWAEAPSVEDERQAVATFGEFFGETGKLPVDEAVEAGGVRDVVDGLRKGNPLKDLSPQLSEGVRFFVLGLAPNAARLSVRFYVEDDFGQIAERYGRFVEALRIEPPPKDRHPSIWRLLIETATLRKSDNIPPNLAGEWLRTILTGGRYPLSLRATLLMRMRADKDVNGLRVAMLKAVEISHLPKTCHHEVPVSLDPANKDSGYLLGRLFATYEYAQIQALGSGVNATIRDQYYGTASATPRAVFPLLQRKATHHLSRLRKDRPGVAVNLDRKIGEIFELADADTLFVPTLTAPRQALFAIGYYHQRNDFYRRKDGADTATTDAATMGDTDA